MLHRIFSLTLTTFLILLSSEYNFAQQNFTQKGEASFYSDKFAGRYTASGEIYAPDKLTAAHLTLPFNTKVKVTNATNNKSVIVTINDRGPYIRGRIIDLSKAAAQQIDLINAGTAEVVIEVIEKNAENNPVTDPDNNTTENAVTQPIETYKEETTNVNSGFYQIDVNSTMVTGYGIQLASYRESANLLQMASELKQKIGENIIVQVTTINTDKVYRLIVGPYNTKTRAEQLQKSIKVFYPQCFVISLSQH